MVLPAASSLPPDVTLLISPTPLPPLLPPAAARPPAARCDGVCSGGMRPPMPDAAGAAAAAEGGPDGAGMLPFHAGCSVSGRAGPRPAAGTTRSALLLDVAPTPRAAAAAGAGAGAGAAVADVVGAAAPLPGGAAESGTCAGGAAAPGTREIMPGDASDEGPRHETRAVPPGAGAGARVGAPPAAGPAPGPSIKPMRGDAVPSAGVNSDGRLLGAPLGVTSSVGTVTSGDSVRSSAGGTKLCGRAAAGCGPTTAAAAAGATGACSGVSGMGDPAAVGAPEPLLPPVMGDRTGPLALRP